MHSPEERRHGSDSRIGIYVEMGLLESQVIKVMEYNVDTV
jgi:hypothetical protein